MCSIQNLACSRVLKRSSKLSRRVFWLTMTTLSRSWSMVSSPVGPLGGHQALQELRADVEVTHLGGVGGDLLEGHRHQLPRVGAAQGEHLEGLGVHRFQGSELLLARVGLGIGAGAEV